MIVDDNKMPIPNAGEGIDTNSGGNTNPPTGDGNTNPPNTDNDIPPVVLTKEQLAALEAYKKQVKEALEAERLADKQANDKIMAEMAKTVEELKVSQMKDEERKRYEEQKKIEEESREKLALAQQNNDLMAQIEKMKTEGYVRDTLAKYSFIEPKYKTKALTMSRDEFDRFFTEDFIKDQQELSEYRKRDANNGNRNAFNGVTNSQMGSSGSTADSKMKEYKDSYLKSILGK
ncbi:MAG: hypothetical protein ACRDD8_05300 [Bacteroidales bacterium]